MGFSISNAKGFAIEFSNGITLSVQWGPGNYCDNRDAEYRAPKTVDRWTSTDAEIAVIIDGNLIHLKDDTVAGYVSADTVGRIVGALVALVNPTPASAADVVVPLLK